MKKYLWHLTPTAVGIFIALSAILSLRFLWSLSAGRVAGGSLGNIATRAALVILLLTVLSYFAAAFGDWEERRKRKRGGPE